MQSLSHTQIKNFKNQSVIKYFYKYISDHNLRQEALLLLEQYQSAKRSLMENSKPENSEGEDAAYGYEDVEAIL
ncbi:MAG: hypothetical protein A2Z91_09350 [Deltaproteobacteria bacterium GWA2_38_16]|nr:MAG: hypothetical protein A2Z91_09350 [Deltaproteobacteria bacterium GWA2_38_16]OGQ02498.1 MAG: hypothetical protein A3D19_09380 [Deltaproteobacteria bacterium RIFCSPHIGHO2_02_FULL_38_15]OGQ33211.1 MAG: hypothetical protein A3A72_04615 [Deltaproteobacteria bacterium RIFCSPLOWO2_01_FULL_38_9]HBQ21047.1 hypothetical protein [Deltaproteobacteria bacterium]